MTRDRDTGNVFTFVSPLLSFNFAQMSFIRKLSVSSFRAYRNFIYDVIILLPLYLICNLYVIFVSLQLIMTFLAMIFSCDFDNKPLEQVISTRPNST